MRMGDSNVRANRSQISVGISTAEELERIYQLRHDIYALELRQREPNAAGRLTDSLDGSNLFIVARLHGSIAGFISITTPERQQYSIDKYFTRTELPFTIDRRVYEIRLLSILKQHRQREFALLLMYAAFRWVQAHGGIRIVAIGRREVIGMYLRAGLQPTSLSTKSGAVTYDLLFAEVDKLNEHAATFAPLLTRLEPRIDWNFPFSFRVPPPCFHGGAFFKAVGEKFEQLDRSAEVISADVLDAWFPPAPGVLASLHEHLPWLLRTSPPTSCEGLIEVIAEARGVLPQHILPGAGSSDLIFRAFREWLNERSRVLILDPTYGEYAHVLERVIRCKVDRHILTREYNYDVQLDLLQRAFKNDFDLIVLVNPNSPTGRSIPCAALRQFLQQVPERTKVWVDETYIDYLGTGASLETFAVQSPNVIVCKSMSKVYALSGARVGYLCGASENLERLRSITPPWVIGLPSQVAAVEALNDPSYYSSRYAETHVLREELYAALLDLGWDITIGCANFLLCHLPGDGLTAAELVSRCHANNLFIRNAGTTSPSLGEHAVRIAVKDRKTNMRMLEILRRGACA